MDNVKLTQDEKITALEKAVLNKSPEETAQVYKKLGKVRYTANAMMYACRFKGVSHVKALVENGGNFSARKKDGNFEYSACVLNTPYPVRPAQERIGFPAVPPTELLDEAANVSFLSFEERAKVLEYLLENREKTGFLPEKTLYYAVLLNDTEMYEVLKKNDVSFSEELIDFFTGGNNQLLWYEYRSLLCWLSDGDFIPVFERILKETGTEKPLHLNDSLFEYKAKTFVSPEIFPFFLEHFDRNKMNQSNIIKKIIDNDQVKSLPVVEKTGWLKLPKKRDEMIEYASAKDRPEAAAWLLDYKNRTANLVKENENREKRFERELNAVPDSVSEMKKIWSFKKQEDGTLMITNYKGFDKEITVPAKIGKIPVTAIGTYAFSPFGSRMTGAESTHRKNITEIILPEGITTIGDYAFFKCFALESVTIPEGVKEIGGMAFMFCQKIRSIRLPPSIVKIAETPADTKKKFGDFGAFAADFDLTAIVDRGSYAEKYCKRNDIKFTYKDD